MLLISLEFLLCEQLLLTLKKRNGSKLKFLFPYFDSWGYLGHEKVWNIHLLLGIDWFPVTSFFKKKWANETFKQSSTEFVKLKCCY